MNRTFMVVVLGGVIATNWVHILATKQIPRPDYTPPPYSTRSAVEPLTRQIDVSSIAVSPAAIRATSSDWTRMAIADGGWFVRLN